jgi:hypothetical protein
MSRRAGYQIAVPLPILDQLLCDDYSRLRKGNLLTVLDGPDEKHPVLEMRSDRDADKGLHQKVIV